MDQGTGGSTSATEHNPMQTLYHAANIIKSDLRECTGIDLQPLSLSDLTLSGSKNMIPSSLYHFLCWVVCKDSGLTHAEDVKAADERHIIMIGQDIIHSASHG